MAKESTRTTTVLSLRVPNALADAVRAKAGTGDGALTTWLTRVLQQAVAGKVLGMSEGFAEGRRQGWAFGNKILREALKAAATRLK